MTTNFSLLTVFRNNRDDFVDDFVTDFVDDFVDDFCVFLSFKSVEKSFGVTYDLYYSNYSFKERGVCES